MRHAGSHQRVRQTVIALAKFAKQFERSSVLKNVVASIAKDRNVGAPRKGSLPHIWLLHVLQFKLPTTTANRYATAIALCLREEWSDDVIEQKIGLNGLTGKKHKRVHKVRVRAAPRRTS